MEKTTAKQTYEAPDLTVVSFKVENGFVISGDPRAIFGGWNGNSGSDAEEDAMYDYEVENNGNYFSW